ncbi:recombinase family protein [Nocardiopsis sp. NPDC006832]|uniref:recombinase family protein n=1 Tax=Nocardiopsis sp. NPDC006832 TaxID=3157188 RepID=UPI0033E19068
MPVAAISIRVSHADQASVSVVTQERLCRDLCERNGWKVHKVYVDENVSGAVPPEDRDGMAELLADLPHLDYVVSAKLDRLSRRTSHLLDLVETFKGAGVKPVTADGEITPHNADNMIGLFAWLAQLERDRIRERTTESRAEVLASGRVNNNAPYGYRIVRRNGGAFLEIDPETADTVRDLARRSIDGQTVADLVAWLNRHKIPTPRMHAAKVAGRDPKPARWTAATLRTMLISPALRGIRTKYPREEVRDADGRPVLDSKGRPRVKRLPPAECYRPDGSLDVIADEVLDAATWHAVREALASRGFTRKRPAKTDSPLSRAARCGVCEGPMHHSRSTVKGRSWRYYRCSAYKSCTTVRADYLDEHVDRWFRETFYGLHVYRDEITRGHDVTAELADTERALEGLTTAIEASPASAAVLGARVAELDARRSALVAERDKPREVVRVATGETYADVWERADGLGKRALLEDMGVTVAVARGQRGRHGFDPSRVTIAVENPEYADAADALSASLADAA